ncbi:MAG TPA: cytochrome b, partial [Pseudonocardia sp.]|nr:cytochrome b [Pseudonocardia sp.]
RMNQLGSSGHPVAGSLLRPDPPEETAALASARAELARSNGHDAEPGEHSDERRPELAGRPQHLDN